MSPSLGIKALGSAVEQWNAQSLDGYLRLYREDVLLHGYSGVEPGFAGVKKFYQALWSAFPGAKLVIEDVFASEDKVTCRFVLQGLHTGAFQGIPPTGRAISLPGITILRFTGDQCVERWSQANFLSLLQQLGAVPA